MVLGGDLRTKKEYETHGGEQFVLVSSLEPVLRRQNASVCAKGLELLLLIANCSTAAQWFRRFYVTRGNHNVRSSE